MLMQPNPGVFLRIIVFKKSTHHENMMASLPLEKLACVLTFPQVSNVILSFLSAKTICRSARLVCKDWNKQAEIVLQRRRQYYWQIFQGDTEKDSEGCILKMKHFFELLPVSPQHVIIFCSSKLYESKSRNRKVPFLKTFKSFLPCKCKVSCIVTDGIIGTSSDMKDTLELETNDVMAASVLCFGRCVGLELRSLKLDSSLAAEIKGFVKKQMGTMPQQLMDVGQNLKTLLAFSEESCEPDVCQALYMSLEAPLIAGGIVKTLSMDSQFSAFPACQSELLSCLGFCGTGVQTASVMFSMQVDSPEEAEKVVSRLREKAAAMSLHKSIAFMFACVGRGEYHYGAPNVESSAFRKFFPNTPLLGFFGNGEIGYEFPREGDGNQPRMLHAYTTALVLICLP